MKAVVIDRYGGPDVVQIRDIPVPEIGPDQVLVRVATAGVNPVDWKIREGYLSGVFPSELPIILGWEMAGTIEKLGEEVEDYKPGDRVYGYIYKDVIQQGTFAGFAAVDSDTLTAMPVNLDFSEAATIPLTSLTAWQTLIDFAGLKRNESVFIAAGAGGVGGFAIQIAKYAGARVCATASEHNHDYLRSLGVDVAIDYHYEDISARIHEFVPEGVDVVLDCTGSEDVEVNFNYVRKGTGRVVTINGLPYTLPALQACAKAHDVKADIVFVKADGAGLKKITGLIEQELLKPPVYEEFPLDQATAALARSQEGHIRGKLVLRIS
ncbi:MAG: NADP-dependent oxidoreductase [Gammaproteobacteria bacterium]